MEGFDKDRCAERETEAVFEGKCCAALTTSIHFYEGQIKTAEILVWAGTMKDRYLSARWKTFFDRSFYNGHAPTLTGKQAAFLISGPLSQNENLRQILAAHLEIQGANLAGVVSDEVGDSAEIDRLLDDLARRLLHYAAAAFIKPLSFLGVGGNKLFRDEVWSRLRIVFQADHRAYSRAGAYDFPQKDLTTRMLNAVVPLLLKIPGLRREFVKRIKPGMVQPYQKIIEGEN